MTQAIGYVRCSTDKQDMSLEQQREKLQAFAASRGWMLDQIYMDNAISGSDMDRPGLADMVRRVESDASVYAVITWDRNRLARPKDAIDGVVLERRILKAGKRVFYVSTNQEAGRSFSDSITSLVENHQNGDYLRKLSRDTVRGVVSRVKRGRWPGGPIPFGFDRLFVDASGAPRKIVRQLNDRSLLVLDAISGAVIEEVGPGKTYKKQDHEEVTLIPSEPGRVGMVRKMFADYAAGVPVRRIRDELNASGFRTSYGRTFCIPSLNVILENAAYVGRCVYNKRTESKWHRLVVNGGNTASSVERLSGDEGLEYRPESDWIVTESAWEAIVDRETFDRVQAKRSASRGDYVRVSGHAVRAGYLLTGLGVCGVCGSKLTGCTTTNGKGVRTRYYVCSAHHRGDLAACAKRFSVPAQVVEEHLLGLIRSDLENLRDDDDLYTRVVDEYRRLMGDEVDTAQQLQRRLAELDQQSTRLRKHLVSMDPATAKAMGLYDEAKTVTEEKATIERRLVELSASRVDVPSVETLRERIGQAFDKLETGFAGGTIEEQRELIGLYVQTIKAEPDRNTVKISLYPPLFSRGIGVAGFEPTTSCTQMRRSTTNPTYYFALNSGYYGGYSAFEKSRRG